MERYTQRQLKALVKSGAAQDVTHDHGRTILEPYTKIGYSAGVYGCNGMLLRGCNTGNLYAVTARTTAIFLY